MCCSGCLSRALHEQKILLEESEDIKRRQDALNKSSSASSGDSSTATGSTWSSDVMVLLKEFKRVPWRLVLPASLASMFNAWCSLAKEVAFGRVTDVLTKSVLNTTVWGGGLNSTSVVYGKSSNILLESDGRSILESSSGDSLFSSVFSFSAWVYYGSLSLSGLYQNPLSSALCLFLVLSVGEWVFNITKDVMLTHAMTERIVVSRTRFLRSILAQDLTFHGQQKASALTDRLINASNDVDTIVVHTLERLLRGLTAVATVVAMIYLDYSMTLLAIGMRLPFMFQLIEKGVQLAASLERVQTNAFEQTVARANESISNVRLVQASGAEDSEVEGFSKLITKQAQVRSSAALSRSFFSNVEAAVLIVTNAIMLAYGGYRMSRGTMTLGLFLTYSKAAEHFTHHFHALEAIYVSIRSASLTAKNYFALRDRIPDIGNEDGDVLVEPSYNSASTSSSSSSSATHPPSDSSTVTSPSVSSSSVPSRNGRLRRRTSATRTVAAASTATDAAPLLTSSQPTIASKMVPRNPHTDIARAAPYSVGDIVFENVSFEYGKSSSSSSSSSSSTSAAGAEKAVSTSISASTRVLRDINLVIESGKLTALVGGSGGGKSSITKLLMRFYDPTSGSISAFVDFKPAATATSNTSERERAISRKKVSLRELNLRSWRLSIGNVDQEVPLLDRSVYENIAFGVRCTSAVEEASMKERVIDAAKHANAHEFIMALPQQYDTPLGERGGRLSGGMRQRVAIARAIFRDPAILILDECSSALDSVSEAVVNAALATLMRNRTTIMISHRLANVRHAHKIVVLNKGAIVEEGTHEELVQRQGPYATLLSIPEQGRVVVEGGH